MQSASSPRPRDGRPATCRLLLPWLFLLLVLPHVAARPCGTVRLTAFDTSVKSWPAESKRWALVVGVSDYEDKGLAPLKSAAPDARLLADALKQYAGFPQQNIHLLTSDQPKESQPRRANLFARMAEIKRQMPKDALLVVAFCGHAVEVGDRAFLMLTDAPRLNDPGLMEQAALSFAAIEQWVLDTGVQQVVMLLNTCRNDARAANAGGTYKRAFNFDGRTSSVTAYAQLYAISQGQPAYESNGQSFYMQAVVEALRGGTVNDKGEVTLAALFNYVEDEIPRRASRQQAPAPRMDDVIRGYQPADLVVARFAPQREPAQAAAKSSIDEQVLDYKFWESIQGRNDPAEFEEYLRRFPNGVFSGLAKIRLRALKEAAPATARPRDAADSPADPVETTYWNSIANSNNKEAYNAYLAQYPRGRFVEAARKRLVELDEVGYWNGISGSTTPDAFGEYLRRYPNGQFAAQAKARLDEFNEATAWRNIENSADPQAFKAYLERYPNGKYARSAKSRMDELQEKMVWQSVSNSTSIEAFVEYLRQYPNGKYAAVAKSRFDELTEAAFWNSIAASSGPEPFAEYLKRYPNGKFAEQARGKQAALAELPYWTSIMNSGDPEAFKEYLRRYPNGSFARLATLRVDELNKARAGAAPQAVAERKEEKPERATAAVNRVEPPPSPAPTEAATKPVGSVARSPLEPLLRPFEFYTRILGPQGQPGSRHRRQARVFVEDISGVAMQMVEVPGGEFLQGTSEKAFSQVLNDSTRHLANRTGQGTVADAIKAQMPQHSVAVQPFYMGVYEVTQAQWRAVARLPKVNRDLTPDPSSFKGDALPVENVSWDDAVEFCERLSRATGRTYRLPTEAEWEYACRAGGNREFYLGETITPEWANYDGRAPYGTGPLGFYRPGLDTTRPNFGPGFGGRVDSTSSATGGRSTSPDPNERFIYRGQTLTVGGLGVANAFGLYDMHGNVWEWCQDNWHDTYQGAPGDGRAWEGGDASSKVLRGGAWSSLAAYCRSAFRLKAGTGARRSDVGLRVVMVNR